MYAYTRGGAGGCKRGCGSADCLLRAVVATRVERAERTLAPRALRVRPLCEEGALAAGRTRPLPEKWCLSEGVGTSQTGNGLLLPGRHTCSRWSRVRAGSSRRRRAAMGVKRT